jgi:lipid II:glycine glycyltransferase (peptidoglycan interpeptide bridge formation enzyme)
MSTIKAKILGPEDKEVFNQFVNLSPFGDILQFWQWGEVKKDQGWKPLRIAVVEEGYLILTAQILLKSVPFLGNYAHAPHGPVTQNVQELEKGLPVFTEFLTHISKTYNFAAVEIEPRIGKIVEPQDVEYSSTIKTLTDPKILEIYEKNGYQVTGRNVEPIHKLYYDLDKNEEELLSLCKKNTRYNIRLAEKKGVQINEYLPDDPQINQKIEEFYKLLLETQKRAKGYPVRSISTFKKLFEAFKGTNNLALFEAKFENDVIVMNISQRTKNWSSSFYAGSNRLHTKLKAPYLLRWKSVLKAKEEGSRLYDFWGIVSDKEHAGYSDQKLSFGGLRIDNIGLLALPISPFKYAIWDNVIWLRTEGKIKARKLVYKTSENVKKISAKILKKALEYLSLLKNWVIKKAREIKEKSNKQEINSLVLIEKDKPEKEEEKQEIIIRDKKEIK